jgi:O-antigen/teichoic acid export membrane protein
MRKMLKVTTLSGTLTIVKMLIGFAIAKAVAVYAGPSGMAMLGQVQSMASSFTGIINAPVGSGLVRYTSEHHLKGYEHCSPWWRASIVWLIALLLLLIPFGLIMSSSISMLLFESLEYRWVVILNVVLLPISSIGTLINSVLNGKEEYKRYLGLGFVSTLSSGIVMLLMIYNYQLAGALLSVSIQAALIGLILVVLNFRADWFKSLLWFGKSELKNFWGVGKYIVMAVTGAIATPIALVVIRNILVENCGWSSAGQWQAVWKVSEVYLSVITIALSTYYLPRMSKLESTDAIISEILSTAKFVVPLVIFLSLSVYLGRDIVIYILFTDEFSASRDLFLIQLFGDVVKICCWLITYPILARGVYKLFIFNEIFFSISFVLLAHWFVLNYGVQGANMAYLVNYLLCFVFMFYKIRQIRF